MSTYLPAALGASSRLEALRRTGLLDSPPEEAFDRLVRVARTALGVPVSLVTLVDADRQFFKSQIGLPEPWASLRETPLSHSFCQHVAEDERPLVIADARVHDALSSNLAIRDLNVVAYAGFPLRAPGGEVLGSFCAIDSQPREWQPHELEILRDLAAAATTEIGLRAASEQAAGAVVRMAHLESVTDAALSNLSLDELLDQMLQRIVQALEVDTATVLLVDGSELAVRASSGLEAEVVERVRVPIGAGFAGSVLASSAPVAHEDFASVKPHSYLLRDAGLVSALGVPLIAGEEPIGVMHVGSRTERSFTRDEVDLLVLAADRVARGVVNTRLFEREQRIADTLQRSMLPESVPQLPGLVSGMRYLPAEHATQVGGDWYDVFALGAGRAGVSVGDIAGHGIKAAAEMWRVRSALQAYAFECGDPAETLRRTDRLLVAGPLAPMVTALMITVDAAAGTARIARAGHPPPILLLPGEAPRVVSEAGGPPLGIAFGLDRADGVTVPFPPGATLLAYTDGLVERRGCHIDACIAKLTAVAADAPAEVEAACDHVLDRMLGGEPPTDDVALVVVRAA